MSFTVQDVGLASLTLSHPVLPPGFSLVGAFPTTIGPGATATFTLRMSTDAVGVPFGQMTFSTNVSGEETFGFNLDGTVTGAPAVGSPTIVFGGPAAVFDPRIGPVAIDPGLVLTDGSAGGFKGGKLTVELASGGTTADHLAIANQGIRAGQVSWNGDRVLFGGKVVGTVTGGDGLRPLVVTFNAASSVAAVQAVARDVVFRSSLPVTTEPRYVRVGLTDSAGLTSAGAVKKVDLDPGLPAVTLTPRSRYIIRGGQGRFTVTLQSQPENHVTITLVPDSNLSLNRKTLTFTPTNWLTPQTVIAKASAHPRGTLATINAQVAPGSDPNYIGLAVAPVQVTITRATKLVVTTEPPGSVSAGAPFRLIVRAEDGFGVVDPTFTGTIKLSIKHNPTGGRLHGGVSVRAAAGVARFSGVTLSLPGNGYTLWASTAGLTSGTTKPINVKRSRSPRFVNALPPSMAYGQEFAFISRL